LVSGVQMVGMLISGATDYLTSRTSFDGYGANYPDNKPRNCRVVNACAADGQPSWCNIFDSTTKKALAVSATGKCEVSAEAYSIDECAKECKDDEGAKINAPATATEDDLGIEWANCNGENVLGIAAIMPLLPVVYAWLGSEFPPCPTDCGSAQSAQTRAVPCIGSNGAVAMDEASCIDPKPAEVKTCEATEMCPIINSWVAAAFPDCPGTCGTTESIQTRGVTCEGSDGSIAELESSCIAAKPATTNTCASTPRCQDARDGAANKPLVKATSGGGKVFPSLCLAFWACASTACT
jgi:hypothetical protein